MTVYVRDGDPVSFAAASIYPLESSPVSVPPRAAQPDRRRTRHAARPNHEDATRPSAAVSGPRRSRGPPPDDDGLDLLDIPTVCRRSGLGRCTSMWLSAAASSEPASTAA
jgi:hypothetical protein